MHSFEYACPPRHGVCIRVCVGMKQRGYSLITSINMWCVSVLSVHNRVHPYRRSWSLSLFFYVEEPSWPWPRRGRVLVVQAELLWDRGRHD